MNETRTSNSIRNIVFSVVSYVVTILLQFINRSVFVNYLSTEYLGLNGLFSNILSMLALSELGIGTAMAYAMYKPINDKDTEKIKSYMRLYKKWYNRIGLFILAAGAALTPFLQFLIADMPDMKYIHVYYLLYVANTGISYFYTYKRSLIICDQKAYISTATLTIASIVSKLSQILILIFTHNYMLYLVVSIVITRAENIWISKIADKKYPYLMDKKVVELSDTEKNVLKNNVLAMLFHKIGTVVINATDNLIISKVLGLASVGLYSNYVLIIDNISSFVTKSLYSVTASVGNLLASKDKDRVENVFFKMLFAEFWIVSFCAICLLCLLQPFVTVWLGKNYLLSFQTVIVLAACFYVFNMRHTVLIFKEAAGLFAQDKYKAIIESIVNLVVSIPLTYLLGVTGVKLGTLISTVTVSFWFEGVVLYKFYYGKSARLYFGVQSKYLCVTIGMGVLTYGLCQLHSTQGLLGLALDGIICALVPNLVLILIFHKTDEFRYFWNMIIGKIRKIRIK